MNQDNNEEKSKQVKLMFEIYGYAQNVCIWLGDHEHNSELAMKFIRERVCDLGAFALVIEDESTKEEWKAFAAVMVSYRSKIPFRSQETFANSFAPTS